MGSAERSKPLPVITAESVKAFLDSFDSSEPLTAESVKSFLDSIDCFLLDCDGVLVGAQTVQSPIGN
jgi:hypothetical protein